jgi:hypothetical protein
MATRGVLGTFEEGGGVYMRKGFIERKRERVKVKRTRIRVEST